jgi:Tol biopolymer transport system component
VKIAIALGLLLGAALSLAGPSAEAQRHEPAAAYGGGTIVFSCGGCPRAVSRTTLFTVRPSGAGYRRVVAGGPFGLYRPRWSPDRRWIAAESDERGIWLVSPRGATRRLTIDCCDAGPAAWSPDGRRLVFTRNGVPHVVGLDGKPARELFHRTRFRDPDWSPSGRWILYVGEGSQLFIARADGRRRFALRRRGSHPRWAPNGRSISYFRADDGALVVSRLGTRRERVLFADWDLNRLIAPAWSPDGRFLVAASYYSFRAGGEDFQGHHFVIAPVKGGRPRRVPIPELPHETYSELYGLDWR